MFYDIKKSGECIRQLRIERGLTQEKVANSLNIDQSFFSRIESGRKGCSVDLFVQLSEIFHVSLDILILGQEASTSKDKDRIQLKADIAELIDQLTQLQTRL